VEDKMSFIGNFVDNALGVAKVVLLQTGYRADRIDDAFHFLRTFDFKFLKECRKRYKEEKNGSK
jgi:hypothetical protein